MNDEINIISMDDFDSKRIAVLCLPGLEGFLGDIVEHLKIDYNVKTCYSQSMNDHVKLIDWCDLCWIEWCNELAVQLTREVPLLEERKVILRLHSYEALSGFCPHVRWSVVNTLLFVAEHVKDVVLKQVPGLQNPELNPPEIFVVPNGVRV